jgi:hypothetical protein
LNVFTESLAQLLAPSVNHTQHGQLNERAYIDASKYPTRLRRLVNTAAFQVWIEKMVRVRE